MAYTEIQLQALESALAKGERRVTFADKTVEYRSVDELMAAIREVRATLNKPSKISAQTWMTQFFGLLCLSRGPFGQFAGR